MNGPVEMLADIGGTIPRVKVDKRSRKATLTLWIGVQEVELVGTVGDVQWFAQKVLAELEGADR